MQLFPSFERFGELAADSGVVPVYREFLFDVDTAVTAYAKLAEPPFGFLLESVVGGEQWARYSFLGTRPRSAWRLQKGQVSGWTPEVGWVDVEVAEVELADAELAEVELAEVGLADVELAELKLAEVEQSLRWRKKLSWGTLSKRTWSKRKLSWRKLSWPKLSR